MKSGQSAFSSHATSREPEGFCVPYRENGPNTALPFSVLSWFLHTRWSGREIVAERKRGVQGLKTKGSSLLVNTGMVKRKSKKTHTPEDISSKNSVVEDQLIGSLDNKYDDGVQKLIDI